MRGPLRSIPNGEKFRNRADCTWEVSSCYQLVLVAPGIPKPQDSGALRLSVQWQHKRENQLHFHQATRSFHVTSLDRSVDSVRQHI